ncbi:MAG: 3-keto-disaccharide hydrolase [Opitutaceae bacterium]
MKYLPCLLALLSFAYPVIAEDGFKLLFNGKDLSGWLSAREQATEGAGRFSVNLDEQAIHVYANESTETKQDIDYLYTESEYSDYVLKLEYKWLEKRFEPRPTHDRDSGLLFHVHGDLLKVWPKCLEMQLGESSADKTKDRYATGDLWVIGRDVHVMNARNKDDFYVPGLPLVPVGTTHSYDKSYITEANEKAHGEWNEITLTVRGGKEAIFELNGKVVNQISQMTYLVDDQRVPLDHGRIGLQAEYAELLYRNIRIKELPAQ